MFRLVISSFPDLDANFGISCKPNEYVLQDADEVCEVLKRISHLKPIVTLTPLDVVSAADVLKDFEVKDIEINQV